MDCVFYHRILDDNFESDCFVKGSNNLEIIFAIKLIWDIRQTIEIIFNFGNENETTSIFGNNYNLLKQWTKI